MLRSPQDTHLRSLLDQRSTRADIRGSFSAISEESDTPSVYSRPFFSPKSSDNSQYQDYPSPTFDIHAHLDHLDQPSDYTPSILDFDDLDDDQRSSFAPSERIDIDETSNEDGDNNSTDRMSCLGPKMRFHSRAPWELEDDTDEKEAETEGHRPFQSVFPFRGNGSKSVTSSSSSPRPSYATNRPSGDSSHSQVPSKRSFETINSQLSYQPGTFNTLAQESVLSHGQSTPPTQKNASRSNFSLGRLRSESSNVDLSPSTNPSPGRSPLNARFPPSIQDNDQFVASVDSHIRKAKGISVMSEASVHPYANPDLAVSCPTPPFRAMSISQQRTSNEANTALSESCTTDSISRTGAGDTTVNSALSKRRMSSIQSKVISSPLPLFGSPQQIETPLPENRLEQTVSPCINDLSGWTDSNAPAFSLISLEEARAQRMRSATVNSASRMSDGIPSLLFPPIETEAAPGAPVGGSIMRARARSISAGANRARSALQTLVSQPKPERRDSEPTFIVAQPFNAGHPGKTLKHKKSGFMRLFNAGKVPERNEQKIPPPVPSLPDSHSINHVQSIAQRTSKTSVHRIPVPRLSPPLFEPSRAQSHDTFMTDTWKQSTRRTPGLSINIQRPPVAGVVSASFVDDYGSQTQSPWQVDQPLLQSAPAVVSEFPALKLRPVSLFSDHFGDHIVASESRPSSELDSATPRSSSPALTPVSATQASHNQPAKYSSLDNQASLVRSLQEQLAEAKKDWQLHIWELEGQVRDLKATVEGLKGSDNNYCQCCGRITVAAAPPHSESVVHRPRARTGTSSRFTNALP